MTSNPSIQYLAVCLKMPTPIVEGYWRQARRHAKAGSTGYISAWEFLAQMLSKTFSTKIFGQEAVIVNCGPVHMDVMFHPNPTVHRIPSCLLIVESATSS